MFLLAFAVLALWKGKRLVVVLLDLAAVAIIGLQWYVRAGRDITVIPEVIFSDAWSLSGIVMNLFESVGM